MAYFISQLGSGTQDGSSADNAWAVATVNATNWNTIGMSEGVGKTVYLLGTITTVLTISYGSGGASIQDPTYIRGDYPGQEAIITVTTLNFNSGRPYVHYKNIYFKDCENVPINMSGTSDYQEVYGCTFDNCNYGVFLNQSEYSQIHDNVFNEGALTSYSVRISGLANHWAIFNNTINGYVPPLAESTGDDNGTPTHSGIQCNNTPNAYGVIYGNRINNLWGDALHFVHDGVGYGSEPTHIEVFGNIIGPRVKTTFSIEGGRYNKVYNNVLIMDNHFTDPDPVLKLGDNFGNGEPADFNEIYNNIIANTPGSTKILVSGAPVAIPNDNFFDYNVYINHTTNPWLMRWDDGGIPEGFSLTKMRTDLGFELNGFEATLGILNSDYTISYDSAYHHAGKTVRFNSKDFKGHKFNIPPTIGAYEFTSRSAAKSGRTW